MRKLFKPLALCLVFGCTALPAVHSSAEPAGSPAVYDSTNLTDLGQTVSDENLEALDGRQDTRIDQLNAQISDVNSNIEMDSNILSAVNSTIENGANSIGQSAFANANGFVTVIQNSGNQVLIKNDTVLNLFMK